MQRFGVWILTALAFAGVGGWCGWSLTHVRPAEEEAEESSARAAAATPPVRRNEAGDSVLRFAVEAQKRVDLRMEPLPAATHVPELSAFGVLQEDPDSSYTLRAPLAGRLIAPPTGDWPDMGSEASGGTIVARLEPRLGPVEMADLAARLTEAQGNVEEIQAQLAASRSSYESKRQLNSGAEKLVADHVLREAEAAVKGQEARFEAAEAIVRLLSAAVPSATQPAQAVPLVIPFGGRVVERAVQIGESVEAGQPLLRLIRPDRFLARISLPAGSVPDEQAVSARLTIAGRPDRWLSARRVAIASAADAVTGGLTYLFAVEAEDLPLQPGLAVAAYMSTSGEPRRGVLIPRAAVVRLGGKSWVYVQTGEEEFTRREVAEAVTRDDGWFAERGFEAGERVVSTGAQSLLAEELRHQTVSTEEDEE